LKKGEKVFVPSSNSKISGIDFRNQTLVFSDFANDAFYITNEDFRDARKFGKSGSGEAEFHGPNGIFIDEKNYIYVVDTGNHRIQKFNSAGKFVTQFGKNGEYEGELASPSDITQAGEFLYITDTDNNRIAVFDDSGNFIKNITIEGMHSPAGISSTGSFLIISDTRSGLIYYNTENQAVKLLEKYKDDNSFSRLNSAVYDREGFLYALDHGRESVEILAPLKKKYSNIDVEITSVDTRKFPTIALYVNVKNRNGSPVYSLEKDNFSVTEDKAVIHSLYVDYFKDKKQSVKAEICIDRSNESKEWSGDLKWVNEFFMQKMTKDDRVKILNFNSVLWTGNDFDWSRRRTLKAVSANDYAAGKNFGKAIYSAISDMVDSQNRRSVIVITDGSVNGNSFRQYDEKKVIYFAREHYIPVTVIYFSQIDDSLKRIASATGGSIIKASQADKLRDLYASIKKAEEYRYAVIYTTFKQRDKFAGWWSDVTIDVNTGGQKGTEWGGYFVPEK
jgi:DNA-binding beta-propeller fold protein YncE